MTATKTVSERVKEYRQDLDKRMGSMDPMERIALVDAYEKRLIDEATAPLRSYAAKQEAEKAEAKRIADAEREAGEKARREAQMATLRRDLEAAWLRGGGEPEDFEANWPRMRDEHLSTHALSTRDASREAYARRMRDAF